MAQKRKPGRGGHTFVQLRHDVMRSENFATLSPHATKLLIDMVSQYNGKNNGDLCMAWTFMEPRGWRSKSTLYRARDELIERGWIKVARQGGKHLASLYAITWLPIDECNGKLDIGETYKASDEWKQVQIENGAPNTGHIGTAVVPITQAGRRKSA